MRDDVEDQFTLDVDEPVDRVVDDFPFIHGTSDFGPDFSLKIQVLTDRPTWHHYFLLMNQQITL